jgi:uncharacterized protein (TIGR01777 family)
MTGRVAITGSSGMLGTALMRSLEQDGIEVVRVRRGRESDPYALWNPASGWVRGGAFEECDVIVNLSGASIGTERWTRNRKALIRSSRIDLTRALVDHLATLSHRPPALINASAVGYYGNRGDELLTEESARGSGFLADLVADWEREAMTAEELGMRVVTLRSGVVLEGEVLRRMAKPFRLGVGGRLGNGRQWFAWHSLPDHVRAIRFLMASELSGPVNVLAPGSVTNREFTASMARALRRPALFPVPRLALRVVFGKRADELFFASQRAVPERLKQAGFEWAHPGVDTALVSALHGLA